MALIFTILDAVDVAFTEAAVGAGITLTLMLAALSLTTRYEARKAPEIVRDGTLTHVAFYFPKEFGNDAFQVKWYAQVHSIVVRRR
jgi:hypothetical protein